MDRHRFRIESSREQERVHRIVGGSAEAFRSLVTDYYPLAYSLAYRVLNDAGDAEEVVQDAFLRIHRALASFRGDASLKTWILRVVHRLSLNRRRDRSRTAWHRLGLSRRDEASARAEAELVAREPDPESRLISRQTRELVLEAMGELSEPLRDVLVLSTLEGLTYEEIGRILQVPVGTVSSRLHAARQQLVRELSRRELI
ncbi:MAG: sigma-70 family RNA polymerase sigma factor [Gemmatimonadota bacterium]